MSLDPLYPRKDAEAQAAVQRWHAKQPAKSYLLTWGDRTQAQAFSSETSAINYAFILATVYGTKDAQLTGPDYEYHACGDECGRLLRDGIGVRLSPTWVVCDPCAKRHLTVGEARERDHRVDKQQDDLYSRVRR